ncbi:MAG: YihY/virulence factor BrkB family protein, partial [Actinobacteria bacterium]|nr:YihY/virulence factor BrkB family protein [Actinomycetota bacterium]
MNALRRVTSSQRGMMRALRRTPVIGTVLAVQRRYGDDEGAQLASTITYSAFLSLFPLLLLAFSSIGILMRDPASRAHWVERLSNAIPGLKPMIGDNVSALSRTAAAAGIAGLIALAWTGTGVVKSAGNAASKVFGVRPHGGIKSYAWALSSLAILGVLGL